MHEKFDHAIGYITSLINRKAETHPISSIDAMDITQSGCPNIIPGLHASPFWDTTEFEWVTELERHFPVIKKEFMSMRERYYSTDSRDSRDINNSSNFQRYRSPKSSACDNSASDDLGAFATTKGTRCMNAGHCYISVIVVCLLGDWNVCYLYLHGLDFADNLAACPETVKVIE